MQRSPQELGDLPNTGPPSFSNLNKPFFLVDGCYQLPKQHNAHKNRITHTALPSHMSIQFLLFYVQRVYRKAIQDWKIH
jgi:hypothetical protein